MAFGLALPFSWVLERAALRGRRPAGKSVATVLIGAAGVVLGLGVAHAFSVIAQEFQAGISGNSEDSPTNFTWAYLIFIPALAGLGLGLSRWQYGRVLRLHAVTGGLLILAAVALGGLMYGPQ
ncbi:hypothetical protein [Deinococcus sp.]|uniref:hypothetical protein n=1 Tax=Deinococcus sp. TaxID=47478 RepID=UPI0025C32957|nr:hypothetical protein [Deinococcus sp.]